MIDRRSFFKACSGAAAIAVELYKTSIASIEDQNIQLAIDQLNNNLNSQLNSRFRLFGEPLNSDLTEMIDDFRSDYHSIAKLSPDQIELIKYYEEDDLIKENLKRSRNGFPWVAFRVAVIVTDSKLKTAFDNQENIYGLDYIFYDSTHFDEQVIRQQLAYTEMLFIVLEGENSTKLNRLLKIIYFAKGMGIIVIGINNRPNEIHSQTIADIRELGVCIITIPSVDIQTKKKRNYTYTTDIIHSVRSVVELITNRGLPSGTFEDISFFFSQSRHVTMGYGYGKYKDKTSIATATALKYINDTVKGKTSSMLVNITVGNDYAISDYENVLNTITNAMIKVPLDVFAFTVIKPELINRLEVTIFATT